VNVLAVNLFISLITKVIVLYVWLLVISALMNWAVSSSIINTDNRFVYFLNCITAPLLAPIRRFLPFMNKGEMDISPIVLIVILQFILFLLNDYFG
jgi:YggT family protein